MQQTTRGKFALAAAAAALATGLAAGCAPPESVGPSAAPASADGAPAAEGLAARISAAADAAGAEVGVYAESLDTGESVDVSADDSFPLLSTFKVYAVAAMLDRFGIGEGLDARVPIENDDLVENSPVTSAHAGGDMSYRELAVAALTRSDNTAGNLLLTRIGGPSAIADIARRAGDEESHLERWELELNEATPGDGRDSTTARGLATGYRAVLDGDVLEPEARELVLGWMGDTETSDTLSRAALPEGWTTADKSGAGYYGTRNSAGLVLGPDGQRVLLVVLSRDAENKRDAPYADALLAQIAAESTELAA